MEDRIRLHIYNHFLSTGKAPLRAETAAALDLPEKEIQRVYGKLSRDHTVFLEPRTQEIRMANPFSAVATDFRVTVQGQAMYANCSWDALGIPAMTGSDARIEAHCADCGGDFPFEIRQGQLSDTNGLIHIAVPARRWWEDVVFT